MPQKDRVYAAIDLKSFYASVECVERGLDPLRVNLVVADAARTEKTICLAVSPSLKECGIHGRPRLFEVIQRVREVNSARQRRAPGRRLSGESYDSEVLNTSPTTALSFITATPRMALYVDYSTRIYDIYLKYIAPEDIHVYSIDEVFIDLTAYLDLYRVTATELAQRMIRDVFEATGITATAGIGTNLFLSKVAMDIVAKHAQPDKNGVRMAVLDEAGYRARLWEHTPLTDFWQIGPGYSKKLALNGMYTMGDIARFSLEHEDRLYKLFGVNAELLIDHAWGWEPCTMAAIKAYRPASSSLSTGQVLPEPYSFEKGRLIVREMAQSLALDLLQKKLVTDQIVLMVGYDTQSLAAPEQAESYKGAITTDAYGRSRPKHAHGSCDLPKKTASARIITDAVIDLYERIVDSRLLVRRVSIGANRIEDEAAVNARPRQLDLFSDTDDEKAKDEALERERRMQTAVLSIKRKYGKNSILKGMDLEEGATAAQRNEQIGGHKA